VDPNLYNVDFRPYKLGKMPMVNIEVTTKLSYPRPLKVRIKVRFQRIRGGRRFAAFGFRHTYALRKARTLNATYRKEADALRNSLYALNPRLS
ncbi:MAG: hypothetical protein LC777_02375, partial [Actinobacteria bacterium]|nr:hypothetical protein [Actinomycetota bacterium]